MFCSSGLMLSQRLPVCTLRRGGGGDFVFVVFVVFVVCTRKCSAVQPSAYACLQDGARLRARQEVGGPEEPVSKPNETMRAAARAQ